MLKPRTPLLFQVALFAVACDTAPEVEAFDCATAPTAIEPEAILEGARTRSTCPCPPAAPR